MNILHVESSLNWGGQEHRTVTEARWLNTHGHRAWIACNPGAEIRRRSGDLAAAVRMKRALDPLATATIAAICRRRGIDVVHAHSPKDAWLCAPLHALGLTVVRSRQITNPVRPGWRRSVVYRHGCSRVIATAECIRRSLVEINGVPPERVSVIGEGVDCWEFSPNVDGGVFRREFGVAPHHVLFGLVAMIRPEKGHLTFLEAAHHTLRDHPHARFAIVGEGTGKRELEAELRRRLRATFGTCTTGQVFMTGYREDTPVVFAALDALVVPSTAEAQSLVVPQAFASRKAVIASAVGGLPELVRDGDTGLLVTPGCAEALARSMNRLLADPKLRGRLAANGHAFAQSHLAFEQRMRETLQLYAELSAHRSRRRRANPVRLGRPGPSSTPARRRPGRRAAVLLAAMLLTTLAMRFGSLGRLVDGGTETVVTRLFGWHQDDGGLPPVFTDLPPGHDFDDIAT